MNFVKELFFKLKSKKKDIFNGPIVIFPAGNKSAEEHLLEISKGFDAIKEDPNIIVIKNKDKKQR